MRPVGGLPRLVRPPSRDGAGRPSLIPRGDPTGSRARADLVRSYVCSCNISSSSSPIVPPPLRGDVREECGMSRMRLENGIACPTRAPAPGSDRSEIGGLCSRFRSRPAAGAPVSPESAGKVTATSWGGFTPPYSGGGQAPRRSLSAAGRGSGAQEDGTSIGQSVRWAQRAE